MQDRIRRFHSINCSFLRLVLLLLLLLWSTVLIKPIIMVDESFMFAHGLEIAGFDPGKWSIKTRTRHFKASYGCLPVVCLKIWTDVLHNLSNEDRRAAAVDHLFWTLYFLKKYPEEDLMAAKFDKDEKTIRKWVWTCIRRLQALKDQKVSTFGERASVTFILLILLVLRVLYRLYFLQSILRRSSFRSTVPTAVLKSPTTGISHGSPTSIKAQLSSMRSESPSLTATVSGLPGLTVAVSMT
jgi:hypothetical protein